MGKAIWESSKEAKWQERKKYGSNVDITHERSWFGRTNIIRWPCWFGLNSTRLSNKQRYCRHLQEHVWIQNLCWSYRKATKYKEIWCRNNIFMALWHGRSCEEMCGKILRTCKQINSTVVQSRNSMYWRPSIQRRRNGICWRIVNSLLTDCSKMPVFGPHW